MILGANLGFTFQFKTWALQKPLATDLGKAQFLPVLSRGRVL